MLKTFINLASAVSEGATITAASLSESGLILIDGTTEDSQRFHLTYRLELENENP